MTSRPLLASLFCASLAPAADPAAVFEKRIKPIFASPNPSSCVQCHLAGVDLKNYILPSADDTFRSLRDQGLIDLAAPGKSKILALIQMGEADPKAPAVHAANRAAEYEAFAAWIAACAADEKLRTAPKLAPADQARPPRPDAVLRHARKDRLLESFDRNVWALRFRCMNCHTAGTPQNDKLRREYGDRVAWVKGDAAATMEYLLAGKLIDGANPDQSPLLRKPLGTVKHEGGVKFAVGDQAHKGFRRWVEDVAAIRADKYKTAADLPPAAGRSVAFGTDLWLKLTDTPDAWGDKLVQVDVYAWDAAKRAWEAAPVASSDRKVWGKGKLWQHNLTLTAAPGSERAKAWAARPPALTPGKYSLKVYVDATGRLEKDWTAALGEGDYVGRVEIRGEWKAGYGQMTAASALGLRKDQ